MYIVHCNVFEGPFEVLLDLIEKDKLCISDISLASITDAFCAHFSHVSEKHPTVCADFLVIAAKLILIKSRTLIPSFAVSQEEEAEIYELKEKLMQYQMIRRLSRIIAHQYHRNVAYDRMFSYKKVVVFFPPQGIDGTTLYTYAQQLSLTQEQAHIQQPVPQQQDVMISFEEKIKDIKMRLQEQCRQNFSMIYDKKERVMVIITFLAVLELVKQCFLSAQQNERFGEIQLNLVAQDVMPI